MRNPDRVSVQVLDGDYTVVVDTLVPKRLVDHHVPLTGGERIVRRVRILRTTDTDSKMLGLIGAFADDVHVSPVQRLETPND